MVTLGRVGEVKEMLDSKKLDPHERKNKFTRLYTDSHVLLNNPKSDLTENSVKERP